MVNLLIYIYIVFWALFNQYVLIELGAGIPDITPQLIIVPVLALIVIFRTNRVEYGGFFVWLALYLIYTLISVAINSISNIINVSQLLIQTYVLPYLIYFVIYNSRKKLNYKLLALAGIAGASLIAGVGIAEFIAGKNIIGSIDYDETREITLYRTNGPFYDSISYASLLLPYVSYIYYCKQRSFIKGTLAICSSLFISIGSFINFSRAAILSLSVIIISCYAKKRVITGFIILSIITIPIASIFSEQISGLLSIEAVQQRTDTATMTKRWELYNNVLNVIYENPLLGIGYDRYSEIYGGSTHNSYLQVMVETGIIGLFLFLMLVKSLVITDLRRSIKLNDPIEIRARLGIAFVVLFVPNTIGLLHSPHFLTALMILLGCMNASFSNYLDTNREATESENRKNKINHNKRFLGMKSP